MKSKKTTPSVNILNVGQTIKNHIDNKRIYKSALARKLQRDDSAILRYQKSSTLSTGLLEEICHELKHNFFADIAAQLPDTYTTDVAPDTTKEERIAQLEKEVEVLKAKYEAVLEVAKGR